MGRDVDVFGFLEAVVVAEMFEAGGLLLGQDADILFEDAEHLQVSVCRSIEQGFDGVEHS